MDRNNKEMMPIEKEITCDFCRGKVSQGYYFKLTRHERGKTPTDPENNRYFHGLGCLELYRRGLEGTGKYL